ncbi:MAG TPA: hypothetical protein VGQ51_17175 [Puia sp.]|jgi:hypothetical protein|nr:hypothetical protein [Puia sp.]
MKLSSILLFGFLAFNFCEGQSVQWSTTKNWKIYKGEGFQIFSYRVDTLRQIRSQSLEKDSVLYYLQKAQPIPTEKTPVWMGEYLATYESPEGKTYKVEVSIYGGFFCDQNSGKYYEVPFELRRQWLNYVTKNVPN